MDNELFYNPVTFSNENHPETLHQGFEAGAQATLFEALTLYGNVTYEDATFEANPFQNNEIPAVPNVKVNSGLRIHNIVPGLVFSVDYHYVGSSHIISDQANLLAELESYYSIDSRLSYQWKTIKAFVGVNNITDQEYSEYAVKSNFAPTRNFYPAPETNWVAGIQFIF